MTLTELEKLEALHAAHGIMALPQVFDAFPEMAKALREAWAHNEKLIETLKETDVRAAEWLGILEKMERERDEAIEARAQAGYSAAQFMRKFNEAEKERDEARNYAENRNDEANKLQRFLNMAAQERNEARAEVERLNGKLLEEARWVYDTGQRAKDALAEVERLRIENHHLVRAVDWAKDEMSKLREVVRQVHALTTEETAWETFPGMTAKYMREIHNITKGMVE